MHITATNIDIKNLIAVLLPRNFTAGEVHLIPFRQKAGWALKLARTWWFHPF
jgi:hypothetical protein